MSDLISRADAIEEISKGVWNEQELIDRIKALPSAVAVDCTDFIDWIRKVVADEELWDLNAVGYGEIICRKLVEIGALATTEKPPYYYVPSADAVPQLRQTDTLIIADALRYLAKDTERHLVDRTRADALRQQFLKYGASMCKGGAE